MTNETNRALIALCRVVLETVAEADAMGAPGGHLYAALMSVGISLSTFQELMGTLVKLSLLRHAGHCYHITDDGRKWLDKIAA